jgi:hypothetical protein
MRTLPILIVTLASVVPVLAQDANAPAEPNAPAPDAAPADAEEIRAIVKSVKGICEKRSASRKDDKWTAIKKDDELRGMTLVRTGLGAELELAFSDRIRMTIRQATKIGIRDFYLQGSKAAGKLGVKYGSVRAKVSPAAGENDFRVATPVATLSVRGSGGTLAMWGDLGLFFRGQSGKWVLDPPGAPERVITKGEWTKGDGTRSKELLAQFGHVPFGDPLGGLTDDELGHLRRYGDGRGVIGFAGSGHQFTRLTDFRYHDSNGSNGSESVGSPQDRVGGENGENWYEFGYEEQVDKNQ